MEDLFVAIANGADLDTIKSMIETSEFDVNTRDRRGDSPLRVACSFQRQDVVVYLLRETGAVHTADDMFAAIANLDLDIVKLLIETSEFDVNSPDKRGYTPLRRAARCKRPDIVLYLMREAGAMPTMEDLCCAIENDIDLDTIKIMIEMSSGIDINTQDKYGDTPLCQCAWQRQGRVDVAQHLLEEAGACVAVRGNGETPLMCATRATLWDEWGDSSDSNDSSDSSDSSDSNDSSDTLCKLLLRHGGLPTIDDVDEALGRTALMFAVRRGRYGVVNTLLENHADMAVRDREGKTAMDLAVDGGDGDIVALLQKEEARRRLPGKTVKCYK